MSTYRWNNIEISKNNELFLGIKNNSYFYFLHSYYLKNNNQNYIISNTKYGENFISALCKNVYGIQFHPEKSHVDGEKILTNFINCNVKKKNNTLFTT